MNAKRATLLARLALASLLVLGVVLFFALGLERHLTLDALRAGQAQWQQAYAEQPWALRGGFFAVYVLSTALSLPGATLLTLAGGAIFGWGWGLLLASFASSLGATLAFWSARFVLRDLVLQRLGQGPGSRWAEMERGLERDGALYLFGLRLIPVFPFFVINIAMGLTRLPVWTFYWVSQVGMLAGTAVYVNAGTQLGQLQSVADIASPGLLASFALLGLFPLGAKAFLAWLQQRRVYAPWQHQRPRRFERNLVVIGAGAAGLVSSYIAAAARARVSLVEAHRMGGDCLNTGCVPSKALLHAARTVRTLREAEGLGIQSAPGAVDFRRVMQRVQQVIADITPHDSVERYTGLGVDVIAGHATLLNPWTVQIQRLDGSRQTLTTRAVVIAAGARPILPDIPGLSGVACLTSDTLWDTLAALDAAPRRMVVLGGGPIGCELAQALACLGTEVTLVEKAPRLLAQEDEDVAREVLLGLQADGVRVLTGAEALHCTAASPATAARPAGAASDSLQVRHGGQVLDLPFDYLLCAVGRRARMEGYGLETLGIETGHSIPTNEFLQTRLPNILVAGDAVGPLQFTHVAAHQAWYATVNALLGGIYRFKAHYRAIPRTTYTTPEVARVGLSEQEAQAQGLPHEVTRFPLAELDRAIVDGHTQGFVKVLTAPGRDRILGATIVGTQAGELLAEYTLAMTHGLGLSKVLGTVHPYPTLSEASKYAAGVWRRAHAPERLLRWAQRWHAWRRGD